MVSPGGKKRLPKNPKIFYIGGIRKEKFKGGGVIKLYDCNAIARILDMTPKNVKRLTDKGVIKTKSGCLYDFLEANHAYINYLREKNSEADTDLDFATERARLTKAKRLNEEMDLAVKKGELHRAEDIKKVMSATLINFKTRITAIPAEEAEALAAMNDKSEIFTYLNSRVKEALDELSNFQEVFKDQLKDDEEAD